MLVFYSLKFSFTNSDTVHNLSFLHSSKSCVCLKSLLLSFMCHTEICLNAICFKLQMLQSALCCWVITVSYTERYLFEKIESVGKANLNCLTSVSGLQLPGYAGSYPQNPSQCPVDPIWVLCWDYAYCIIWIQVWFGEYRLQFMQVLILFSQLLTSCLPTAFILRNLSCSSSCWCFYLVFRNGFTFLCQLYILKVSSHRLSENEMSRLLRQLRTTPIPLPMQHDFLLYFLPYKLLFFFHKFKCFFTYSWCKVSYSLITVIAFPLGCPSKKGIFFISASSVYV